MATQTSKKPQAPRPKPLKLTFTQGDPGAWYSDPQTDGSGLAWQVQSRRDQQERGFDLLLLKPKSNSQALFIRWFELRSQAQALAATLTKAKLTWEKALKRYGPYDREKNSAIKAHPKRTAPRY